VAPSATGDRQPHAVLDLPSRSLKALKIERLLRLADRPGPLRLLEIGTGSGGIAHWFGTHPSGRYEVDAVDVVDNRLVREGFRYADVTDTRLPFADASFDVVLSNHVIEHVGDTDAQRAHLAELRRVLRDDGVGYLAVPSRWMLVEPHFKLPLLSWLPAPLADRYVRMAGRGTHYDCRPLTVPRVESLLAQAGFAFAQCHAEALRLTFELEAPRSRLYRAVLRPMPDAAYAALRRAFPTLIYTLSPKAAASAAAPVDQSGRAP
jgi:SAM-dependent methyltransferase